MKETIRKRKIRWGSVCVCGIAAACVCAALLAAPLFQQNADAAAKDDQKRPPAPTKAYTATSAVSRVVLTGENTSQGKEMAVMDEMVPGPGKVYISPSMSGALEDPDNADALFYVTIFIYYDLSQDFTYNGKTLDEWYADPALSKYEEVYQIWYGDVYLPYDAKIRAAEERGEEYAQGWEKHDPWELFDNYWNETQPEDIKAAYSIAKENAAGAKAAYHNWLVSDEYKHLKNDVIDNECSRLINLGYDLNISGGRLIGNLTKQQIEDFTACSEYGYMIGWADKDSSFDEQL